MAGTVSDLARLAGALGGLERLGGGAPELVGIGWATVDLERTLLGLTGLPMGQEVAEPSLGALARVGWAGPVALVVLEPTTEGRLAAALARRGEGIACLYLGSRERLGGARTTALGRPGRLLPHDRPWGPFLMLVEPADRG